ncbi:histamine H2 receptor-like [Liolophura sinensis]|uniref:histamine H2 receptor-like n=1 Tax=Liolophura sinensis TaxID=3198878 RepID=UPI00315983BA
MSFRNIFAGCLGLLVITGSIGNGLVIIVTAIDRKLRTLSHNLIAALSITDLIICGFFLPMCVIRILDIDKNRRVCFLTSFLSPILTILSTQIQAILSVARYKITTSRRKMSPTFHKVVYGALGLCVIFDAGLYCTFVVPGGNIKYNPYLGLCTREKPVFPGQPISFVVLFYLAAVIAIIFYIKIRQFVAKYSFSLNRKQQRQNRLTRLLFRLFIAWTTGYSFVILIRFLDRQVSFSPLMYQAAYFILWANSCANPIMYNSNNEEFSTAFRNLMGKREPGEQFKGQLLSTSSSMLTRSKSETKSINKTKNEI